MTSKKQQQNETVIHGCTHGTGVSDYSAVRFVSRELIGVVITTDRTTLFIKSGSMVVTMPGGTCGSEAVFVMQSGGSPGMR
jgi:hypothetical protein